HGVLDFIEPGPGGSAVPIGSALRRRRTFWEVAGDAGVPVAVVGWLATFPATPVNGWLVSDRFTIHPYEPVDTEPTSDPAGKTYPPSLFQEIAGFLVRPSDLTRQDLVKDFGPQIMKGLDAGAPRAEKASGRSADPDERALRVISATTRTYAAIAVHLLERKR